MSDDELDYICVECGSTPFDWVEFRDQLREYIDAKYHIDENGVKLGNSGAKISNNELRRMMYQQFTYLRYGQLGLGVQIMVPNCVGFGIK